MTSRPPVFTWNEELHFGPPSEPVHIQSFLDQAEKFNSRGLWPWLDFKSQGTPKDQAFTAISGWKEWQELSEEARTSVQADCNLEDIKSRLLSTFASQERMAYMENLHAEVIAELDPHPAPKKKGKGKAKNIPISSELVSLQNVVKHTPLRIWKIESAAKPYIRTGHVSDQNALVELQRTEFDPEISSPDISHEALITFTTYTRNNWYPYGFSRNSQYVLPSASALADIWSCIHCPLKGDGKMPREIVEYEPIDPHGLQPKTWVAGYTMIDRAQDPDSVALVIEDVVYCDGRGTPDYADKLLAHLATLDVPPSAPDAQRPILLAPYERPKSTKPLQKGRTIYQVPLRSLCLRLNEPYWILHRGNCEHWFVIDEIRLQNPRDPLTGYPIGLQRTPIFRPLCRICAKVPATLSILHDVRLGESPAMLCKPCWDLFGGPPQPKEGEDPATRVVEVPMVFETS